MKKWLVLPLLAVAASCCSPETQPGNPPMEPTPLDRVRAVMKDPETRQIIHEAFAAGCFNGCWKFIDKKERSAADVEDMLATAYASLWHWKQRTDCKPLNLSIGYWQMSRVYALAGEHDMARLFGDRCMQVSRAGKLPPFYIGYAHEALARAALVGGDTATAEAQMKKARATLNDIADNDERALLASDLNALAASIQDRKTAG